MITSKPLMRTISVINYKGGTGKTSTVVSLGHALAMQGNRVLIIDLDPQGSAGYSLGVTHPKRTAYDLLIENCSVYDCIVPARQNLDIICANERLYPAELLMASFDSKEQVLTEKLHELEGYDFVLIDCAPSMNLSNQNALYYASEVILPVSMEYLSLVGVKQLLKNIKIMHKMVRKRLTVTKVVPTFFDKRQAKSRHVLESLERVFPGLVSLPIHANVKLSEAPGHRKTIFEYAPKSRGAKDYQNLMKEVLQHG